MTKENYMIHNRGGIIFLYLCLYLTICLVPASLAEEPKYVPSGPLNVRNDMPLYMFYMAPAPDKAQTLGKGKIEVDISYHVTNTISQQRPAAGQEFGPTEKNREWWVYIDTEVNRFDINLSYGILDNLEICADIPYYVFSDGYLDSFIENFESAFSFIKTPNAREERENNTYEYEIRSRGKPIILSTSHPNDFGEVSTYLKYKVLDETKWLPVTSLRGAVKFPTTSDELLGSKEFDYGIGILLEKTFFKRATLYFNLNYLFLEKPDILEELDVFNPQMLHGIFGAECFLTQKLSMLFQATANTTVYDDGVTSTGREGVVLSLGFNYNFTDKVSWQITMDENTNTAAPDFGLFTGVKVKV